MTEEYEVLIDGSTFTNQTISFKVERNLNERSHLNIKFINDPEISISEGDTISVKVKSHTDTFTKIFQGKIIKTSKGSQEGDPILEADAVDLLDRLDELNVYKTYSNETCKDICLDLLSAESEIGTINVGNCSSVLDFTSRGKTRLEAVKDLGFRVGWDWYLDTDNDFHFFERDSIDSGKTIKLEHLENYSYKKDRSSIVNKIVVLGAEYTIPDPAGAWSDSLDSWYGSPESPILVGNTISFPPRLGKYAISEQSSSCTSCYLRRTFSALDLTKVWAPKAINIDIGFESDVDVSKVYLILEKDESNYYYRDITSHFNPIGGTWRSFSASVGPESTWDFSGNPSWDSINAIKVLLEFTSASSVKLYIDRVYFAGARYHGFAEDPTSQTNWGICEPPHVVKDNIYSNSECQTLADKIVYENKDPKEIIEDTTLYPGWEDLELGSKVTLEIPEGTFTKRVLKLVHNYQDGDFSTDLTLSKKTRTLSEILQEYDQGIEQERAEKEEYKPGAAPPTSPSIPTSFDDLGDITDVSDVIPSAPAFVVNTEQIDNAGTFETWFKITITRDDVAGGYIIAYKKTTVNDYQEIWVDQPESGNPIVTTPSLPASMSYNIKVAAVSQKGTRGNWQTTFDWYDENGTLHSSVSSATTASNDVKPNPPSSITATPTVNGVILKWSSVDANDLDYYEVYKGTSSPPDTKVGEARRPYYVWRMTSEDSYTGYYFGVRAVDTAGNPSDLTSTPTTTEPLQVKNLDIAPDSVTTEKILNQAVREAKLADLAVSAPKLEAGAVTETAISDFSISTPKLMANCVMSHNIAAHAVTADKIDAGAVTARKLTVYSIFLEDINFSVSSGSLSWSSGIVQYEGNTYDIGEGSTTGDKYIVWRKSNPNVFTAEEEKPSFAEDTYIIGIFEGGTWHPVWNATLIHGGSIITDTITSKEIKARSIEAESLRTNIITSAVPKQNNLVPNPEFEIPDPDNPNIPFYYYEATEGNTNPTYALDSSNSHRGKYALKMHSKTTDKAGVRLKEEAMIPVEEGREYVFKLKAKASTTVTLGYNIAVVELFSDKDFGSYLYTHAIEDKNVPTDWKTFSVEFSVDSGARYASIRFYNIQPSDECDLWIDDVELKEKTSSDEVINIAADQVIISGTTTLTSWKYPGKTTIDGGKIETETIDTDQLKANAITAEKIKAGEITAEKLSIAPQNEVKDGDFELGDASKEWTAGTATTSSPHSGSYCLSLSGGSNSYSKRFIPVKGGKKYHIEGWIRAYSAGNYGYIYIHWYNSEGEQISYSSVGNTATITWSKVESDLDAPSNAYFAKIRLNSSGGTHYFDDIKLWLKSGSVDIQDGAITADHIQANAVTTDELQLKRISSNEPTKEGALYYWTPTDELRFIGETGEKGYIPRYPIDESNAPPENLVPNQSFETARDEESGIPDFWTAVTFSGSPSFGRSTSSQKGGYSAYIELSGAGEGKLRSAFIPVKPGQKYYLSAYFKGSGKTHDFSVVHLEVFDRNKSYDSDKCYEVDLPSEWKTTTTSFSKHSWSYTVPSTHKAKDGVTDIQPRYIRVVLRNHGSSSTYETIYYDDIVFSEMRATEPTPSSVCYYSNVVGDIPALTHGSWNLVKTIQPDEDVEVYFIEVTLASETVQQNYAVKVVVDSTDYPGPNGVGGFLFYESTATFLITVPFNVNGKDVKVYVKPYLYDASAGDVILGITAWGHEPHFHR